MSVQGSKAPPRAREDGLQLRQLPVTGMHCASCALTVERSKYAPKTVEVPTWMTN